LSTATYPNPGSSWVLKDDGPIQSSGGQGNGNGNGNGNGPTLHQSSPDFASAVAQASAADTGLVHGSNALSTEAAPQPSTGWLNPNYGTTQATFNHLISGA